MYDPQTLHALNQAAASRAASRGRKPLVLEEEDLQSFPSSMRAPFPLLGSYVPEGWELLQEPTPIMCDTSGTGQEGREPSQSARLVVASNSCTRRTPPTDTP